MVSTRIICAICAFAVTTLAQGWPLPPSQTGNLYISGFNSHNVGEYRKDGTIVRTFTHPSMQHPRGVAGQMPGCHITDVVVRLWNALDGGDREEAKRVFNLMGPIFALEMLKGSTYGEVLRRRGVIEFSGDRAGGEHLQDENDAVALDEILADLEPLFTWPGSGPLRTSGIESPGASTAALERVEGGSDVDPFDR